jgi:hypothetical protein
MAPLSIVYPKGTKLDGKTRPGCAATEDMALRLLRISRRCTWLGSTKAEYMLCAMLAAAGPTGRSGIWRARAPRSRTLGGISSPAPGI